MSTHNLYTVYDSFAWFFNRYWGDSFAKEVRPVFVERLLPLLPRRARILDLCCGTAQLGRWLTVCGYRVTGLDASEEMIRIARENAPNAEFVIADARSFQMPAPFDAVISTFDSLNHIPSAAELLQVFQNVHKALSEDGLFFFDMNTEEGFRDGGGETHAVVRENHVCIAESSYNPSTRTGKTGITLFRLSQKLWERSDIDILEYYYPEEDIRSLLTQAGFRDVVSYDAERDLDMPAGMGRLFFLAAKQNLPPKVAKPPAPSDDSRPAD